MGYRRIKGGKRFCFWCDVVRVAFKRIGIFTVSVGWRNWVSEAGAVNAYITWADVSCVVLGAALLCSRRCVGTVIDRLCR